MTGESAANSPADWEPVPALLARVRAERSAEFAPGRPLRVSRAPGRLDVMGGIADYTGSTVCEATLDRAAAVASQPREDRFVAVHSFNWADQGRASQYRISLDALCDIPSLRAELARDPESHWAGYLLGCFAILHDRGFIDLRRPDLPGVNLALLSTVPPGAGVSSSAAIEVATMMNLRDHFGLADRLGPMALSALCQAVENRVVGAPCGIMDQVTSCLGRADSLLRMRCQPHELLPPVQLPAGVRVVGINSNVRHSVGGGLYGRTRCAAFMAHAIILHRMRQLGTAAGRPLASDPINGYLANLDPDDYKRLFRPALPERLLGAELIARYGATIDTVTTVDPTVAYAVRQAADHHVLEARRVRRFVEFLEEAARFPGKTREQGRALDKAGHLMYASHLSYTNDALLGSDACDVLVDLVRKHEKAGIYGARITGGGSGGTVAVLADEGPRVDAALGHILQKYEERTGISPELLAGRGPGAWETGTVALTGWG